MTSISTSTSDVIPQEYSIPLSELWKKHDTIRSHLKSRELEVSLLRIKLKEVDYYLEKKIIEEEDKGTIFKHGDRSTKVDTKPLMSSETDCKFEVTPEEYGLPLPELRTKLDKLKKHPVLAAISDLQTHIAKKEKDETDKQLDKLTSRIKFFEEKGIFPDPASLIGTEINQEVGKLLHKSLFTKYPYWGASIIITVIRRGPPWNVVKISKVKPLQQEYESGFPESYQGPHFCMECCMTDDNYGQAPCKHVKSTVCETKTESES